MPVIVKYFDAPIFLQADNIQVSIIIPIAEVHIHCTLLIPGETHGCSIFSKGPITIIAEKLVSSFSGNIHVKITVLVKIRKQNFIYIIRVIQSDIFCYTGKSAISFVFVYDNPVGSGDKKVLVPIIIVICKGGI